MKILVMSDTHRILANAFAVLDQIHSRIDMAIHLGDNVEDAKRLALQYKTIPFHFVPGNCDLRGTAEIEDEKLIAADGVKLFLSHGHRQGVKWDLERMSYATEEVAEIGLFGHTHTPCIAFMGNVTLINPGSLSFPRGTPYPSYAVIDLEKDNKINVSIVEVKSKTNFAIKQTRMFYRRVQ